MRQPVYTLPGISGISIIKAEELPVRVDLKAITEEEIDVPAGEPIDFNRDTAICTVNRDRDDGAYYESAELKFTSTATLPEGDRFAFILTLTDGTHRLIGSREEPRCQAVYEESTGETAGRSRSRDYTVTHKALKTFIKCNLI